MIFHLHRKCFHGTETVKVIRGGGGGAVFQPCYL